jgi:hypothetical protein
MADSSKPIVGIHVQAMPESEQVTALLPHAQTINLAAGARPASSPAALVLAIDEKDEETFKTLRQLRLEFATSPVIVLAAALDTNLAVELVKLGVTDCVCVPAPPDTLWRKIERAMLHSGGPTLDSPLLALLWDGTAYPAHEEKRRCFRSATVADYPAYVTVVKPVALPKMLVKNLSILTEGCPGGFALIGSNVHLHALTKAPQFRFVLSVPDYARPVPGQGVVKRVLSEPTAGDPASIIGVEYRVDDPAHEAPVRRFWSESQRRVAAIVRSSAGLIS